MDRKTLTRESVWDNLSKGQLGKDGKLHRCCLYKQKTPEEVVKCLSANGFIEADPENSLGGWAIRGCSIKWEFDYKYFYECGLDEYLTYWDTTHQFSLMFSLKARLTEEFGRQGKRFFAWWFFSTGGQEYNNFSWKAQPRDLVVDYEISESYKGGGQGAISGHGKFGDSHNFKQKANLYRTHEQKYRRQQKGKVNKK